MTDAASGSEATSAPVCGLPLADASLAGPLGAAGAALCVVLGLIWLAQKAAALRGFARPAGASARLAVAAHASLDARRKLVLVACAGRQVLLLTGGPADLVIGWLPPDPAQAGPARPGPPPSAAGAAGAAP
jgi:flagellar protein FliO/FliZ